MQGTLSRPLLEPLSCRQNTSHHCPSERWELGHLSTRSCSLLAEGVVTSPHSPAPLPVTSLSFREGPGVDCGETWGPPQKWDAAVRR